MRKWILLAFVAGFIAGGVTLYFALPTKNAPDVAKKEGFPDSSSPDQMPPADDTQGLGADAGPSEDLGAPPQGIINDDEGKPTPFAAPDHPGDKSPNPSVGNPDADQLPPDSNPDDGIQDMSNDTDNGQ